MVSNLEGRQVDGAVRSLDVLPEIVDAVRDNVVVPFDCEIRTGSDIVTPLTLDVKAVLVGRPWVCGLGIGGKKGAQGVLLGLLAVSRPKATSDIDSNVFWDLGLTLGLEGLQGVQDCKRAILRKVAFGKWLREAILAQHIETQLLNSTQSDLRVNLIDLFRIY